MPDTSFGEGAPSVKGRFGPKVLVPLVPVYRGMSQGLGEIVCPPPKKKICVRTVTA